MHLMYHASMQSDGYAFVVGLSNGNGAPEEDANCDWRSFDFGLECGAHGELFVLEKGSFKLNPGPKYSPGDTFAVKLVGNEVSYHHRGRCIYQSMQEPKFPLVVKASFHCSGGCARDVGMCTWKSS